MCEFNVNFVCNMMAPCVHASVYMYVYTCMYAFKANCACR